MFKALYNVCSFFNCITLTETIGIAVKLNFVNKRDFESSENQNQIVHRYY